MEFVGRELDRGQFSVADFDPFRIGPFIQRRFILQYVFLAKLWQSYPINAVNDLIHLNVVTIGAVLSVGGSIVIAWRSVHRWRSGAAAAERLDRLAEHPSFTAIQNTLYAISDRSTLRGRPRLMYTPKKALALEVRETSDARQVVVVGLGQRSEERRDPAAFAAKIGREVSHLELTGTRAEIRARRLVVLHFRVFGWLVAIFFLVLGFIDRRGLGSTLAYSTRLSTSAFPPRLRRCCCRP